MTKTRRLLLLGGMMGALVGTCVGAGMDRRSDAGLVLETGEEVVGEAEITMEQLHQQIMTLLTPQDEDFEFTEEMSRELDDLSRQYDQRLMGGVDTLLERGQKGSDDEDVTDLNAQIEMLEKIIEKKDDEFGKEIQRWKKNAYVALDRCRMFQEAKEALSKKIEEADKLARGEHS